MKEQIQEENITPEIAQLKYSGNNTSENKLIAIFNLFSKPKVPNQSPSFTLNIDNNPSVNSNCKFR